MSLEIWATFAMSIAGSVVLLTMREVARPEARQVDIPNRRRDWGAASFGLDLVVAALIGSPAVLAARSGVSDRLGGVREKLPVSAVEAQQALDGFFAVSTDATAAYRVLVVIAMALVSVCAYVLFVRRYGYDPDVPYGCSHPSLRLRGFVLESALGIGVLMGAIFVTAGVTR